MKNKIWIYPLFMMSVLLALTISWTKDDHKSNSNPTTIQDFDGNVYHSVTIGTQVWMVENLKVIHYRNGDPITHVKDLLLWSNLSTEAYCNYDDKGSNSEIYGKLYNWYVVSDDRKLAPTGWHIPTDAEWTILVNYLGGTGVAGIKLKEAGINHWQGLNAEATNESGFTALPGGSRGDVGVYNDLGIFSNWWSSTEHSTDFAFSRSLGNSSSVIRRLEGSKPNGLSIRCIRD